MRNSSADFSTNYILGKVLKEISWSNSDLVERNSDLDFQDLLRVFETAL